MARTTERRHGHVCADRNDPVLVRCDLQATVPVFGHRDHAVHGRRHPVGRRRFPVGQHAAGNEVNTGFVEGCREPSEPIWLRPHVVISERDQFAGSDGERLVDGG